MADELKATIEQIDWPTLKGLQKAVEAFNDEGHKDHGKYSELPETFINGISQCLESQSDAVATLAMREAFSEAWHSASKIEEREALIKFVANTWGGMGLGKETVRELAAQNQVQKTLIESQRDTLDAQKAKLETQDAKLEKQASEIEALKAMMAKIQAKLEK